MGQTEVLKVLQKYPEGLTVTQITNILGTNRYGVDHACNKLLEQEEIKREEVVITVPSKNNSKAQRKAFLFKLNRQ